MNIGILGGGQLGRMLALAGYPLGLKCRIMEPGSDSCAAQVAERSTGDFEDFRALGKFASGLDTVTWEFENVPVDSARWLADRLPVYPPPKALAVAQERVIEKSFFRDQGIPVAPFRSITSREEFTSALQEIQLPAVLKTTRFGYDGKGQMVLKSEDDITLAWEKFGGMPLILEGFVPFDRELSILGVRNISGEIRCWMLTENYHRDGMLRKSIAPAPDISLRLQHRAELFMKHTLEELQYVGVLAIELFQVGDDLVVNEMAPRVHNSGHWTIEGAETSQFENHLRAVSGLPLGSIACRGFSEMRNLIGTLPDLDGVFAIPGVHVHLYGKKPRANRKLGHLTITGETREEVEQRSRLLKKACPDYVDFAG